MTKFVSSVKVSG